MLPDNGNMLPPQESEPQREENNDMVRRTYADTGEGDNSNEPPEPPDA